MNMDYSKYFELLNQDAEKERNEKAKKTVHDNLYNRGYRDGTAVLNKLRAEIKTMGGDIETIADVLTIIDKYKAEVRDK